MQKENKQSLQEWLPFEKVMEKGIIKTRNDTYVKVMKVFPINYNLKSELEKQAILNSYKTFLKTCNFDIQILIQSSKEDLSNHILKIKEKISQENNLNLLKISKKYIEFINRLNLEKNSSSKNFYIIIASKNNSAEDKILSELEENYLKIKETLGRCGNNVKELEKKKEILSILYSFLNARKS